MTCSLFEELSLSALNTFRMCSDHRTLGLAVGFMFTALYFGFFWAYVTSESPPQPVAAILFMTAFWLLFSSLGCYLYLASQMHELTIANQHIHLRDVFRDRRFRIKSVSKATWRLHPQGGSLVLELSGKSMKKVLVSFANYDLSQRPLIRALLRDRIPDEVQQGWEKFAASMAVLNVGAQKKSSPMNQLSIHFSFLIPFVLGIPCVVVVGFLCNEWRTVIAFPIFTSGLWLYVFSSMLKAEAFET